MLLLKILVLSTCVSFVLGETSTTPSYITETPTTTVSPTTPAPTLSPGYMISLKSLVYLLNKYLKENHAEYWTREQKIQNISDFLKKEATKSQKPVLKGLAKLGLDKYASTFWLVNAIRVPHIPPYLLPKVKQIPGVIDVSKEEVAGNDSNITQSATILDDTVQPNIAKVGADRLWSKTRGKGILVGIIDTGVRVTHDCLKDNFAGNHGNKLSWFDPSDMRSKTPNDIGGHGTHCAGTAVGKCGIGAAPEARFIACRNLIGSSGLESWGLKCMQFMSCPRKDMNNEQTPETECGKVPHIVSNSWGLKGSYKKLNDVASIWDQMDILGVFAIGNQITTKNQCHTGKSPGNQIGFFSVGATDNDDMLTGFSCRGPGPDGNTCPTLVAPGLDIVSASDKSDSGFATMSGTSMATPLVAGGIALLLSFEDCYDSGSIQRLITKDGVNNGVTSDDTDSDAICSSEDNPPNNAFGYGRLDLEEAFRAVEAHKFSPKCFS